MLTRPAADATYAIDPRYFDDPSLLPPRVAAADPRRRKALAKALQYLYDPHGRRHLGWRSAVGASPLLDPAERKVVRWLVARTNGGLRRLYGPAALLAARAARYRCEACGFADVRALNLDHVHGRKAPRDEGAFRCLCANCHHIKSHDTQGAGGWRKAAAHGAGAESTPANA